MAPSDGSWDGRPLVAWPEAILSRSATVLALSFSMMLARCASTVLMLMPRSSAICLFRRPGDDALEHLRLARGQARQQGVAAGGFLLCWRRTRRLRSSMRSTSDSSSSSLKGFWMKSIAPFFIVVTPSARRRGR